MAKLIANYDIACINGRDINLSEMTQDKLKVVQKKYPHLVSEEKKKVKNEVSEPESSESNSAPDPS